MSTGVCLSAWLAFLASRRRSKPSTSPVATGPVVAGPVVSAGPVAALASSVPAPVSSVSSTIQMRYLDEFMKLKSAPMLLELGIFPDAKEITEVLGMYNAFRRFVMPNVPELPVAEPALRKCFVCIGDGTTPRCASIFALRTNGWDAVSVDPCMRIHADGSNPWAEIRRVRSAKKCAEEVIVRCDIAVVVLLHAHVPLEVALASIDAKIGVLAVITCPCCQWIQQHTTVWGRAPDVVYSDPSIVSERREVRLWCASLGGHTVRLPVASASDPPTLKPKE